MDLPAAAVPPAPTRPRGAALARPRADAALTVSLWALAAAVGVGLAWAQQVRPRGGPAGDPSPALRDPDAFLAEFAPVPPLPVVLLTKEDAVAQEILGKSRTLTEMQARRTAQALCDEAEALAADPLLFLAVIHIESAYNHLAISPVGAEGLMQLMPGTAEFMAERGKMPWPDGHSFDPVVNVRLGVRYLVELIRGFGGRLDYALTAYNRGPHATRTLLGTYRGLPGTVRAFYAGKVLDRYRLLVEAYGTLPQQG